jgi:hypothetical protein
MQNKSWIGVLAVAFLGISMFWDSSTDTLSFPIDSANDSTNDKYSRLTRSFTARNKIVARNVTEIGGAGTFAGYMGEVIMKIGASDMLPIEFTRKQQWYPKLVTLLEASLSQLSKEEAPSFDKMVLVVIFS